MSVTRVDAREMPVTAKMIATGTWNALKSSPYALWLTFDSAPTFTT